MTKEFVLATQNPGKTREFQQMLKPLGFSLIVPDRMEDVEETGTTFEENARIKAKAFAEKFPEKIVIADDSGLSVNALDGRPGVYSKRYADTDEKRIEKLLQELEGKTDRKAKFVSVICLYGDGIDQCFEGEVVGSIGVTSKGIQGFGYDPIFIPDGYDRTFGELGNEVKNTMSHRARALEKMAKFLKTKGTNNT